MSKLFVLCSGGIDSSTLIHFYKSIKEKPEAIHFQYNQPNAKSELKSFNDIISYFNIKGSIIDIGFNLKQNNHEIFGRNALFIIAAASIIGEPSRISLGIHANTRYYDCSNEFIKTIQQILNGYFQGIIQIETPFINYTKDDIIKYAIKNNVPIDLTYSCITKNSPPCGKCPSCLDRVKYYEH